MSSKNISIGIVSEGATDQYIIGQILGYIAMDVGIDFSINAIQPKYDAINESWTQGGWGLIYSWCKSTITQHGSFEQYIATTGFDILIIQLDADVVYKKYQDCPSISPTPDDIVLPLSQPCPDCDCSIPCHAIGYVEDILKNWCSIISFSKKVIMCIPSKSLDAWVVASMPLADFKEKYQCDDDFKSRLKKIECITNPEQFFDASDKIGKSLKSYKRYSQTFLRNFREVQRKCKMASVFCDEMKSLLLEIASA